MQIFFNSIYTANINSLFDKKTNAPNFKGQLEKDTFCFCENSLNSKISALKNLQAKNFFNELNKTSPKKCEILLNNANIIEHANENYGIFSDRFEKIHSEDLQMLKGVINNLEAYEIQKVLNDTEKRIGEKIMGRSLINALILRNNDKEAFDYIIKSPYYDDEFCYSSGYSLDLCRYVLGLDLNSLDCLSYQSIIEIEKGLKDDFDYSLYTSNSDDFLNNNPNSEKLKNYLLTCKTDGDFTAYRGEKSPWMFDEIELDDTTENEVRQIVADNIETQTDLVYPNTHKYSEYPKENIYNYIKSKDKLSLADALLCAKYSDETFIKKISEQIKNAVIIDNSFKSFTLNKKFALNWAKKKSGNKHETNQMLSILTNNRIKAGNEAGYSARSNQAEFILNNTPKMITFSNVQYDKSTNTFFFDAEITNINKN